MQAQGMGIMGIVDRESFREWRVSHLYKQDELGAALGLSEQAIAKWERGERSPASWTMVALALKGLLFSHGPLCRCPASTCRHWPERYSRNREYPPR